MYDYDYKYFAEIGFNEALEYQSYHGLPKEIRCEKRSFAHTLETTSFVEDVSVVVLSI